MKIRIKGLTIDSAILFRVEWKLPFPKIYLHERFEQIAKWTSRIIVGLGISVSLLALPTFIDFSVAVILLGFEVMVEKIIFEYSVLIVQPPPNFKVDESQWVTNGYLFPEPKFKEQYDLQNHFGPVYNEKKYGELFFDYLMSWNNDSNDDIENNICLSFIIEKDNSYTTYIYANPDRKWLDSAFNEYSESMKLEKYGKVQQSMVMQMVYWKTLPNLKGTLFYSFASTQEKDKIFHICPFYLDKTTLTAIDSHIIRKYHYSFKKREEVTDRDLEFYYGPTIKIDPSKKLSIPPNPQNEINRLFREDLESSINVATGIEFTLAENYQKSPPIICVVFNTPDHASRAYDLTLRRFTNNKSSAEIRKARAGLTLRLIEGKEFSAETKPLIFSNENFDEFKGSEQSKGKIVLVFGFKDGAKTVFVATEKNFSPLLLNRCQFRGQSN